MAIKTNRQANLDDLRQMLRCSLTMCEAGQVFAAMVRIRPRLAVSIELDFENNPQGELEFDKGYRAVMFDFPDPISKLPD